MEPLAPAQQVQLFTTVLHDRIRIDVELLQPLDINMALSLAHAYQRRSQALDSITLARAPVYSICLPHSQGQVAATPTLQPSAGMEARLHCHAHSSV